MWIATPQFNPYNLSTFLKLNRYEKVSILSQWLGLEGLYQVQSLLLDCGIAILAILFLNSHENKQKQKD
jgi:hypothetical protein